MVAVRRCVSLATSSTRRSTSTSVISIRALTRSAAQWRPRGRFPEHVYVTWQDYRTGEFDIQLAVSRDGGQTWTTADRPVNPDRDRDHYQPAVDVGSDHKVAVSYYRTERVPNENRPGRVFRRGQDGVRAEPSNYFLSGVPWTAASLA